MPSGWAPCWKSISLLDSPPFGYRYLSAELTRTLGGGTPGADDVDAFESPRAASATQMPLLVWVNAKLIGSPAPVSGVVAIGMPSEPFRGASYAKIVRFSWSSIAILCFDEIAMPPGNPTELPVVSMEIAFPLTPPTTSPATKAPDAFVPSM